MLAHGARVSRRLDGVMTGQTCDGAQRVTRNEIALRVTRERQWPVCSLGRARRVLARRREWDMQNRHIRWIAGAAVAATLIGLGALAAGSGAGADGAMHASATLRAADGSVVGWATFTEDATGVVHVNVHADGMTTGLHGLHVHAVASCASGATTFSGAGGHHNPLGATHGDHAGDLPNLVVNPAGNGHLVGTTHGFTLTAGTLSVFDADGSALIVHANEDDLHTDPTGNSGGRIACGIIEAG
jgi:superoxide dismutase, Cu-Zn family